MTPTATNDLSELEKLYRAQLLGLGAVALEMHQSGQIDPDLLMSLASDVAKTEDELQLLRRG
jgi:hypothetical protein